MMYNALRAKELLERLERVPVSGGRNHGKAQIMQNLILSVSLAESWNDDNFKSLVESIHDAENWFLEGVR